MNTKKSKRASQPEPPRRIYEAYTGPDLDFCGYVVTSGDDSVERILAVAPADVCDREPDAERKKKEEREGLLKAATAFCANPATKDRKILKWLCVWRDRGQLDSTREIPGDAFEWQLGPVGGGWEKAGKQLCPFCPIRFQKMLVQRAIMLQQEKGVMLLGEISLTPGDTPRIKSYPWHKDAYQATKKRAGRKGARRA